jgi:hypothetical protein
MTIIIERFSGCAIACHDDDRANSASVIECYGAQPKNPKMAESLSKKNMNRQPASVAMGFVRGMLAGLHRLNIDPSPILNSADIDISDSTQRISIARYATLYNQINRKLDDEAFGLFSQPMRLGSFEFLCRSCISAPTLAEALSRAARFLRIVLPDLAVSIRRHHNHAELVIHETRRLTERPDDPGRVFAFEWLLRLIHGLACWLAGRGIGLDSVIFRAVLAPCSPVSAQTCSTCPSAVTKLR